MHCKMSPAIYHYSSISKPIIRLTDTKLVVTRISLKKIISKKMLSIVCVLFVAFLFTLRTCRSFIMGSEKDQRKIG